MKLLYQQCFTPNKLCQGSMLVQPQHINFKEYSKLIVDGEIYRTNITNEETNQNERNLYLNCQELIIFTLRDHQYHSQDRIMCIKYINRLQRGNPKGRTEIPLYGLLGLTRKLKRNLFLQNQTNTPLIKSMGGNRSCRVGFMSGP